MIKYNIEDLLEKMLRLAVNTLNETGSFIFVMPDNKYAITVERSTSGYFVCPNYYRDGFVDRMADGVQVELNDFATLIIRCVWCMEEFFK